MVPASKVFVRFSAFTSVDLNELEGLVESVGDIGEESRNFEVTI